MKKVKIIATIGPSTDSEEMIEKLIRDGVDVFRLNFSHADHETHKKIIEKIRKISKKLQTHTAIMQDISGPKIRIGEIDGILQLKKNDTIKLAKTKIDNDQKCLTISHPEIINQLKIGEYIFFADGSIRAEVVEKQQNHAILEIKNDGILSSKKGVNFPNTKLNISAITEKDKNDLIFGALNGVDIVAISFVNTAKDIKEAKNILKQNGSDAWVVAKIETKAAVENITEIANEADGVMVARGDLGIEIGVEKVPVIQKKIIKKLNAYGKPVIVATQMLLSMVNSPFPTRAEVSDIANAVLDGADAVMLSDETTVGKYPEKAIETLKNTILESQNIYLYHKKYEAMDKDAIAASVSDLCKGIKPKAIISFTASGDTAKSIAKYRPDVPIFAVTHSEKTLRRLSLVWGVKPYLQITKKLTPDSLIEELKKHLEKAESFKKGDKLILTMGSIIGKRGTTNMIRVLEK